MAKFSQLNFKSHLSESRKITPSIYLLKFPFVEVLFTFKNWEIALRYIERFETMAVFKRLYLTIRSPHRNGERVATASCFRRIKHKILQKKTLKTRAGSLKNAPGK